MDERRRDGWIAVALGVAAVVTRLPFVGRILYHWDSINFAYSLDAFDVTRSQPHVPGYPLYVVLIRASHALFPDAQQAIAAIGIAGTGLAVAWVYLLGVRLFDRGVALGAAFLLLSSPLYWFYGEVALPHALDAFVVLFSVWLLWRVLQGESHLLVWSAVWLGLAGGFRPQTEIFLLPIAVFASLRAGRRNIGLAVAALIVVDLLWFVPLVQLSGGLERYLQLTHSFYLAFNETTSIFSGGGLFGLRRNAIKLSMYTLYGWGMGLPLLLAGLAAEIRAHGTARLRAAVSDPRAIVLALWIVPTLLYYQFIHMGQQGLVFVYLPALCLLSALAAKELGSSRVAGIATAVAINAAIFLFAPTFPLGGDRPKLLTLDTLRLHDRSLLTRTAAVRARFDPQNAVVLASTWRFPQYYLPEFRTLSYAIGSRWEAGEGQSLVRDAQTIAPAALGVRGDAEGSRYVILFDPELEGFNAARDRLEWADVAGARMAFLRLNPGEGLALGPSSFGIAPGPGSRGSP